jgi:hypothetical protein
MTKNTPEPYRDPAAGDPNDEADGLRVGDETDDAADLNGDDDDDEVDEDDDDEDDDDDDEDDDDEDDEQEPAE